MPHQQNRKSIRRMGWVQTHGLVQRFRACPTPPMLALARASGLCLLQRWPTATPAHQPAELSRGLFDDRSKATTAHGAHPIPAAQTSGRKITALHPDKKLNIRPGLRHRVAGRAYLGRIDGFLIGVDISKGMIEQAARHGVYDRFHHVVLLDALQDTPDALYQVITALDVFIYTGDISAALADALRISDPGGHLIFRAKQPPRTAPTWCCKPRAATPTGAATSKRCAAGLR